MNYAEVFRSLETEGKLDALNEVDLYCLHFVYLPRICKSLSEFQETWNNHQLSSEGSKTPYQLFFEGISFQLEADTEHSNAAVECAIPDIQCNDPVSVPGNSFKPCPVLFSLLLSVDPQAQSSNYGKEHYYRAVNLCGQHLQNGWAIYVNVPHDDYYNCIIIL